MKYLFFLIFPTAIFAQEQKSQNYTYIIIVDSLSGKGVDGASTLVNNRTYIANQNGLTKISQLDFFTDNQMLISSIGYKSLAVARIIKGNILDTIKLTPSVTALNEIKIKPNKVIRLVPNIGGKYHKVKRITRPEAIYAQFIPNENKIKATISSVTYRLNNDLNGIDKPFRVRIFTKASNSISLGDELTTDSIIVYNPDSKHVLDVDIFKYEIMLPADGVIVVFETLPKSYYGSELVWYNGNQYVKTPGIDMAQTKDNWQIDPEKKNRVGPYSMVGNFVSLSNIANSTGYVYKAGNSFAIAISVVEQ